MIQGPLGLAPRLRRMPVRIENGALTADDPATPRRVRTWLFQHIHVRGRPEWVFVKVYTRGAGSFAARRGGPRPAHRAPPLQRR